MSVESNVTKLVANHSDRPRGITVVAVLMILFGIAEVVTSFTHEFFGLSTSQVIISTYLGAGIGVLYIAGGLLILTMRKWGARLALTCLAADVVGRAAMVLAGLYPVNSFPQTFAIILGTSIAIIFAIYIGRKWSAFK